MSDALDRVIAAGAALRAASDARVIEALDRLSATLGDPAHPVGRAVRDDVAPRSGLSPEGAGWALETTLAELRASVTTPALEAMRRAHAGYRTTPVRAQLLVLAGNVLTGVLRPLAWALLARVPTVVKVAHDDEGLAELCAVALAAIDPELGEALSVVRPPSFGSAAIYGALASRVDVVSAHGGDVAIAEMRAATSPTTDFVPHGHGLGAVLVLREALSSAPEVLARAIALDVAAYDQRGCLSPQVVLVERGGELSARDVASLLSSHGLAALATEMPRGALPTPIGAAQLQWRGLAASVHELFEGDGFATSYEGTGAFRPSPGYRNIAVHEVASVEAAIERLAPLGAHLKSLAVAGDRDRVVLESPLAPRVCAPGEMQRPPLLAATDGVAPWHGLVRLS
jgi:hypothetical protein